MTKPRHLLCGVAGLALLWTAACRSAPRQEGVEQSAQSGEAQHPVDLQQRQSLPFRFVAYGDTRFTAANDTDASNPAARRALVQAIAEAHPSFISISGDISYKADASDWSVWDAETDIWRQQGIPVYPALGNHDLRGDIPTALHNYFLRFPQLKSSRYYSVRVGNVFMLILDTLLDENSGEQGDWLRARLDSLPSGVEFVVLVMHHPPYTSSSDDMKFGGGHSAREAEQQLARLLESRQQKMKARIVVFAGHVHNYERHEHGGVTYFVTGGGGAHPYPIERPPSDPFQSTGVNYHYLLAEMDHGKMTVTMNRLELRNDQSTWTQPDRVTIKTASQ